MKVILTPVGSAGDINPFIVVGRELRRRGHDVSLLAVDPFADIVSKAGLRFVSVGTNDEFDQATNDPNLWHPSRGPRIVFRAVVDGMRSAFTVIEQEFEAGRTMLVGHPLSVCTRVFEEVNRVPAATVHLAPSILRSDFQQSALPSGQDLTAWPRWVKRTVWWAADRFAVDPFLVPPLNAWRAEFGLAPISRIFQSWINSPQRILGFFPDWFAAPQPDWPSQLRLTGFTLSDRSCAPPAESDRDLEAFMAAGDAPLVFTPGSANRHAERFFRAAVDAAVRLHRRAVLVSSYPEHVPAGLPKEVHHAAYAPFATLFQRASAVVHHGGIGTCAQGLAGGVPQLIMPMGFDQPDNALRLKRLGVGESLAPAQFTGPRVAEALQRLLTSSAVAEACKASRDRIQAEDGVGRACDLIEQQFNAWQDRADPNGFLRGPERQPAVHTARRVER
jgi:UDP:flavonoid glycosyltransferase YjiC (YdhE family)